jgi:RecB family exonuclease
VRRAADVLAARLADPPGGPFEGIAAALAPDMARRFGPDHVWSASRLEAYTGCPLRFFVETVLALQTDEAPEPGIDITQLGTLLHAILEDAYRDADDPRDVTAVVASLREAAARRFAAAPTELGFRATALWEHEAASLLSKLERTVEALAALGGDWTPVGFEARFGLGDSPAATFGRAEDRVLVRGVIDRVDRDPRGRLRVIDYKTGGSHLAASDLESGRRLQLPIYAIAARWALGLGEPVDGLYWAILQAKSGLRLQRFGAGGDAGAEEGAGVRAAIAVAVAHVHRAVAGVREARFAPKPPADGCPSYCAAAAWCWRYRPGRHP